MRASVTPASASASSSASSASMGAEPRSTDSREPPSWGTGSAAKCTTPRSPCSPGFFALSGSVQRSSHRPTGAFRASTDASVSRNTQSHTKGARITRNVSFHAMVAGSNAMRSVESTVNDS